METARQKAFPIIGVRQRNVAAEKYTISFKDSISIDRRLRQKAARLGMTRGELLREITRSALAVNECGQSGQCDPLLMTISSLLTETRKSLADGNLSPVERETLTDLVADALGQIRKRRSA